MKKVPQANMLVHYILPLSYMVAVFFQLGRLLQDKTINLPYVTLNSLLALQNFTTARKSGNIILTYYGMTYYGTTIVCQNNVATFSCCCMLF